MNKSEDPTAPKNQPIEEAPHHGRNVEGEIVADATESAGQGGAWDESSDLTPDVDAAQNDRRGEGYASGPTRFAAKSSQRE